MSSLITNDYAPLLGTIDGMTSPAPHQANEDAFLQCKDGGAKISKIDLHLAQDLSGEFVKHGKEYSQNLFDFFSNLEFLFGDINLSMSYSQNVEPLQPKQNDILNDILEPPEFNYVQFLTDQSPDYYVSQYIDVINPLSDNNDTQLAHDHTHMPRNTLKHIAQIAKDASDYQHDLIFREDVKRNPKVIVVSLNDEVSFSQGYIPADIVPVINGATSGMSSGLNPTSGASCLEWDSNTGECNKALNAYCHIDTEYIPNWEHCFDDMNTEWANEEEANIQFPEIQPSLRDLLAEFEKLHEDTEIYVIFALTQNPMQPREEEVDNAYKAEKWWEDTVTVLNKYALLNDSKVKLEAYLVKTTTENWHTDVMNQLLEVPIVCKDLAPSSSSVIIHVIFSLLSLATLSLLFV